MSRDEAEIADDLLTDLLAAYDEAPAAGLGPGPGSQATGGIEAESLSRLSADEEVVALLERVWPRTRNTPSDTTAGPAAAPPARLGRFRVLRELGRGGFGIVYLAADSRLRRKVALKVPRPEALVTPELRTRGGEGGEPGRGRSKELSRLSYASGDAGPCQGAGGWPGVPLATFRLPRRNT